MQENSLIKLETNEMVLTPKQIEKFKKLLEQQTFPILSTIKLKDKVYFSKTKSNAIIPSKTEENAGRDIYACFDEAYLVIAPHKTVMIPTGIASACSNDYYFQLFERGSTGTKGMGQRCGVIDASYRNEWFVPITNHNNDRTIVIRKEGVSNRDIFGDIMPNIIDYPYEKAICQAVLLPVPKVEVEEIPYDELLNMKSDRMLGNLGSSNK
jgi:dUTP pyrophosphatase